MFGSRRLARRRQSGSRLRAAPSGPGHAAWLPYFRYRLHWEDGADAGEAEYVDRILPGELVWLADGQQVRVLDVVETGNRRRYEGLLRVQAA